ncbi:class I adenylate-forming enzyme family protein [Cryptosporangium minutisporangium]|uniref:ATP-dependent acyl-CoA ligase n=1 Tax=Cryptosporangium minutisporangium TaxID=113569 RepID=A0ABP6ST34_9ACTN
MTTVDTAAFPFAGQDVPWLLAGWAERQPDKTFLIWAPHSGPGRSWTYAQFWADVRSIAAGLARRGVRAGDKVLLHADNCPEGVLSWYACATLGAVTVTTNTRSAPDEISYFTAKTGCVAAITQPEYAAQVAAAAPDLKWMAVIGDATFDALHGDGAALPAREPDPLAPVGILFTSGTTSRPKAVVHTHANALWAGRVAPAALRMTAADTYLVYLPFFHVNAQSWSIWTTLGVGGTVVLQPKFSTSRFWDVVTAHRVTHISLIPFVLNAILGQAAPAHTLKVGVFGAVIPELDAALGFSVLPAFGMTETITPAITAGPGLPPASRSMGRPTPGYEALIVDPDTGEICADGRPGELRIRGTRGVQLFAEYYDDPAATAKGFADDGWFRTGDIVRLGETGDLVYCERDSDLLKVGGENVSAREVEDVCRQVPGVADVAVVGGPHPMLDEVPVAFVLVRPDADLGALEAAVIERCRESLADFKVPRAVHVVDEFPRATLDKVAKNKLREQARQLAAQ